MIMLRAPQPHAATTRNTYYVLTVVQMNGCAQSVRTIIVHIACLSARTFCHLLIVYLLYTTNTERDSLNPSVQLYKVK